jgi:hypothetical protein
MLQSAEAEIAEEISTHGLSSTWSDILPELPTQSVPTVVVDIKPSKNEDRVDVPLPLTTQHVEKIEVYSAETLSLPVSPSIAPPPNVIADSHLPDSDVPSTESDHVSETTPDTSNDHSRYTTSDALYTTVSISESRSPNPVSLNNSISALPSASSRLAQSHSESSHTSLSTSTNQSVHTTRPSPSSSVIPTVTPALTVLPPSIPSTTGESIYRTIMNRLTALESNSSLYTRFVEEHAASVREMLRRLAEDVGRLEGIVSVTATVNEKYSY